MLLLNVTTVLYDKFAAKQHLVRVPEAWFYGLAAAGNNVSAVFTLLLFWVCGHKTRKRSFQLKWFAAASIGFALRTFVLGR